MLRLIRSIPDNCPDCGSENLGGQQMLVFEENNTLLCNACGIIMVLQESYDEEEPEAEGADIEMSASFLSCPHCCTINEIQVVEGDEWCNGCGLDPNREDYTSEELAHLWKEGSGIRETMARGVPKSTTTRMYRFLTKLCGPHCAFEESCPQSSGNFAKCFQEEVIDSKNPDLLQIGEEEDEVGRGKRKRSRKAYKHEQERIRKEKERAVLVCAGSGWYEKRYLNEIEDPQKLDNTGSGSGT